MLEPGALADLTTVALDTVRTAGPVPRLAAESAVFARRRRTSAMW